MSLAAASSSPAPIPELNFVWVGPPRITEGGHDVRGIDSFLQSLKDRTDQRDANPLIFWCQKEYKAQYEAYFSEQGIAGCQVLAIEDRLEANLKSADPIVAGHSQAVLKHYRTLTGDARNQTVDRVYFKDMFFQYLMATATKPSYVLDTNIEHMTGEKIHFPYYDKLHYPRLESGNPEVWMLYSCPEDITRARKSLDYYLTKYSHAEKIFRKEPHGLAYHQAIGQIAVESITLGAIADPAEDLGANRIWSVPAKHNGYVSMPMFGVTKGYFNSHREGLAERQDYNAIQFHAATANIEALRRDLKYGANREINMGYDPRDKYRGTKYDADHETVLHLSARSLRYDATLSSQPLACFSLLLDCKEIDTNLISTRWEVIPARRGSPPRQPEKKQYNALRHIIEVGGISGRLRQEAEVNATQALALILRPQHNTKVDVVLDTTTPLMEAVRNRFGVEALLIAGADPNFHWEQRQETPLTIAVQSGSVEMVDLLLKGGANPNMPIQNIVQDYVAIKSEPPILLALKLKKMAIVQMLLASPLIELNVTRQIVIQGKIHETTVYDAARLAGADYAALISQHPKYQGAASENLGVQASNSSNGMVRHGLFAGQAPAPDEALSNGRQQPDAPGTCCTIA